MNEYTINDVDASAPLMAGGWFWQPGGAWSGDGHPREHNPSWCGK